MTAQSCAMQSVSSQATGACAHSAGMPTQEDVARRVHDLFQTHFENGLSRVCKVVLILVPLLIVIAHVLSVDATANFATGWRFGLFDMSINSYPWRSPGGWAVAAGMVGFAFVLGFISWRAVQQGPGFFAWFTAVAAAIAMLRILEVAWHPLAPSREAFESIRKEIESEPQVKASEEVWATALGVSRMPDSRRMKSIGYLQSLRSHWLHVYALLEGQKMVMLTLFGGSLLWGRRVASWRRWRNVHLLVIGWTVMALCGGLLVGQHGLFQRTMLATWYGWLWILFREIERQRKLDFEKAFRARLGLTAEIN